MIDVYERTRHKWALDTPQMTHYSPNKLTLQSNVHTLIFGKSRCHCLGHERSLGEVNFPWSREDNVLVQVQKGGVLVNH